MPKALRPFPPLLGTWSLPVSGWLLPRAQGECTLVKQTLDHCGDLVSPPGEVHIGGQEHFYLETHCTIAVPKGEQGEMELFVSTQNTMKTQVGTLWVSPGARGGHWGVSGRLGVAVWDVGKERSGLVHKGI